MVDVPVGQLWQLSTLAFEYPRLRYLRTADRVLVERYPTEAVQQRNTVLHMLLKIQSRAT